MTERRTTRSGRSPPAPKLKLKKKPALAKQCDAASGEAVKAAAYAPPDVGRSGQLPGAPTPAPPVQTAATARHVAVDEPWQTLLFSRRERRGAAARRAAQQAQRDAMAATVASGSLTTSCLLSRGEHRGCVGGACLFGRADTVSAGWLNSSFPSQSQASALFAQGGLPLWRSGMTACRGANATACAWSRCRSRTASASAPCRGC
jgi:hypothetical protein